MQRFIIIAAVLQIAMVVTGHYNDFVLMNLSAVLGVGIPLVVAFFYGRDAEGVKDGAVGGLAIGFVGAFLGIGLAIAMGDQMLMLLAFGPLSSAVTGAIGGAVGFKLG
jgi:hypothetical protein